MAKKKLKTKPSSMSVHSYISNIEKEELRKDGKRLLEIFKVVTGKRPKLWGTSIVGFGSYHYIYESGREGDFLATGFSLRKSGPTIYIMPGYENYEDLLAKLGPHKLGKSCLYLKRLEDIDESVLKKLIKQGLKDLQKKYPVS